MSRKSKRIRRILLVPVEWIGIALGMCVIPWLSRGMLYALCDCLSALIYFLDRRGKRRALENLRIIRGTCTGLEGTFDFDPDRADYNPTRAERLVIRRSYRNSTRAVAYVIWTCVRPWERSKAICLVDERVAKLLAENNPAVTVSGHIGLWEALPHVVCRAGHRVLSVSKEIGIGGLTYFLRRMRRSIGQEIVFSKGAFKPLMQGLLNGKSLGLLVDQRVSPRKSGIWITFLGRPMTVSPAPAFFAAKAKRPIIVAWARPLKNGRCFCEFLAAHTPEEARDIRGLTQRIADELGTVIRRHPSCWILNYNYFAYRPKGDCD